MSMTTTSTPTAAPTTPTAGAASPGTPNAAITGQGAASAQPTPAEVRKMKLKIDNADVEMSEAEVIALAQQGKSAQKRFQEAAEMRKQSEQLMRMLKENPKEALAKFGIDVRKFSEDSLIEILKEEAMSPDQKRAAENERKLREYEKAAAEAKAKSEADELRAAEEKHMMNYDKMFVEALSASGLPKTTYTVKRMAELQLVNLRKGFDLDANQLAKLVREDYVNEQKALFSSVEGDQLLELLGEDIVKKLSKAQVKKLKSAQPKFSTPTRTDAPKRSSDKPALTWKEWQKSNRGR